MNWLINAEAVPAWPNLCGHCGAEEPDGTQRIKGERLVGSYLVAHVFEVTSVKVPFCGRCSRGEQLLMRCGVLALVLPWVLLTLASLAPTLVPNMPLIRLMYWVGAINLLGFGMLGYRYWRHRVVRMSAVSETELRFAFRCEAFARDDRCHPNVRCPNRGPNIGWRSASSRTFSRTWRAPRGPLSGARLACQ